MRGLDQAQLLREEKIAGYSVTERYTLKNSRFKEPAEMTVAVTYTKSAGKNYRVVSRKGPSFLQSSVLDRLLKEETEMSSGEARKAALMTSKNYRMEWVGEQMESGRKCAVVKLEPLKKSPHLIRGKALVDAGSYQLIRLEGRPAASVSFFASTPDVVREYMEIGAFTFARRSHAVSQSWLLGRTELEIDYLDYQVSLAGGN